jgi:hypothetical protein
MKWDSAPHAPDGAACAECRRMAPDEARRCLMKLLTLHPGQNEQSIARQHPRRANSTSFDI